MKLVDKRIVSDAVRQIKEKHGRDMLKDPRKCRAIIKDYLPGYDIERRFLEAAIEEHIVSDLIDVENQPSQTQRRVLGAMTKRLMDNRGLSEEAAKYTIEALADGVGIIVLPSTKPAQRVKEEKKEAKPVQKTDPRPAQKVETKSEEKIKSRPAQMLFIQRFREKAISEKAENVRTFQIPT